jgi:Ca-activated chloride channel homolog
MLALLVGVVVVAMIGFGWAWVGNLTGHRADPAASSCPQGPETIQVAVAPAIADAVGRAAATFAAGKPVVAGHCVKVTVAAVDPMEVLTALRQGWDTKRLGPKPDAWIADSTLWSNELAATAPTAIADTPQSVAGSPIVLAMPGDAAKAVSTAGAPTWDALPALTAEANGWSAFGQPGWGQFSIALPSPVTNTASALAVEAMLDPASPQGQRPITADLLAARPVRQNLANLAIGQGGPAPDSTHAALLAMGRANGIQDAPFSAVPVAEVELYQRGIGADGAAKALNVLDEVRLSGPTPFLDFPFVPLAGTWITSDQFGAARHFADFLLDPAQQAEFAAAGLRVASSFRHPAASPGMDWGGVSRAATPLDADGYQRLIAAWEAVSRPAH